MQAFEASLDFLAAIVVLSLASWAVMLAPIILILRLLGW